MKGGTHVDPKSSFPGHPARVWAFRGHWYQLTSLELASEEEKVNDQAATEDKLWSELNEVQSDLA